MRKLKFCRDSEKFLYTFNIKRGMNVEKELKYVDKNRMEHF